MSGGLSAWLPAHGRLWYDSPAYRAAWFIWPQALGLLIIASLWLFQPDGQSGVPWARPVGPQPVPVPKPAPFNPPRPIPSPSAPAADALAPCKIQNFAERITRCSELLASGNLTGNDLAQAYFFRGYAYSATSRPDDAMADYDRAIAISPNVPLYYNNRGVLWRDKNDNTRAMADFDRAIALKSDYALAHANRGVILRRLNRLDDALAELSTAIGYDPKLAWAYQNRAFVLEDKQNWRMLYDDAAKLVQLEPNNRLGPEFLGHAYLEVGQYQDAVNEFTKSIGMDANAIYGWRMRGRAYYFMNQFDQAESDFQAALRIDPKDQTTLNFINDLRRARRR